MSKQYTISGPQLRTIIKDAFFAGFKEAQAVHVADAWKESSIRTAIDYRDLFDKLEDEAKAMVSR